MSEVDDVDSAASAAGSDTSDLLPEVVRARVITLAAGALGRMPAEQVPPSLKRVAAFAATRRAKLAGTQIASLVETDAEFREHVASQVRTEVAEVANALESGVTPAAADPVELAAVAYLTRPEGWAEVVRRAGSAAHAERSVVVTHQTFSQLDRLRKQLEAANEELKALRLRNREQLTAVKAENADLRRKLRDARSRLTVAEAIASEAEARVVESDLEAAQASKRNEVEVRRLRGRIEELERELGRSRRAERSGRDEEALRTRLLLDTLLDAAQGLRRELALPAVERSPADAVQAHLAEEGAQVSAGHRSLGEDDPAVLAELLGLPRVHLIIDGYNVTKHAWSEIPLENQRDRLLAGVAALVARSGAEVTVVFDAAELKDRPPVTRPRGVRVLFSPHGVIADDVIRELVDVEPPGRPVVVVSSDQAVIRDVARAGAWTVAASALSRLLSRS